MQIIPAIDLLAGNVVRLRQGKEKSAKIYETDPLCVAQSFQEAEAQIIHVVDLDGAFGRPGFNDATIQRLIMNVSIPIQLGGGIRSRARIAYWLDQGIHRIILGSAAAQNPALVSDAVRKFGSESVVVGIDIQDGLAVVNGWTQSSDTDALTLAESMKSLGIGRIIITEIITDGMLTGPKTDNMRMIARETGLNIIASGGIHTMSDLELLSEMIFDGIEGVIIGRALYENKLLLPEAVERYQI